MEPLKPFTFRIPAAFTQYEPGTEREEIIEYRGETVGRFSQFPVATHGKANVRVNIYTYNSSGGIRVVKFKNRFYTIDEAKTWILSKQLSIFDQYTLVYGE